MNKIKFSCYHYSIALPPPLLNSTVNFFQEIVLSILVQKNDVYATEPTSQLGSLRNNDGDVCVNVT